MTYEEKREKVIYTIVEAHKFASKDVKPLIDGHNEYFEDATLEDISRILKQFEEEGKIKIISQTTSSFEDMFDFEDANLFTIDIYDIEYFKKLIPKPSAKLNIEDSPMRKFKNITNYVTGTTDEERAKIRAIENSIPNTIENNHFFVEYKSDRNIRLNGKILLSKPQFGRDNESIFKWLYDNPNTIYKKQELEEQLGIVISDKFQKITDRWGFRAGLKDTFFDIHEDTINPEKSTIKFKNPVTL